MCLHNSPYSLNCQVGTMLVFRMLCRITLSSDAHWILSVSVMDHNRQWEWILECWTRNSKILLHCIHIIVIELFPVWMPSAFADFTGSRFSFHGLHGLVIYQCTKFQHNLAMQGWVIDDLTHFTPIFQGPSVSPSFSEINESSCVKFKYWARHWPITGTPQVFRLQICCSVWKWRQLKRQLWS